jgi:predicted ester cyclase
VNSLDGIARRRGADNPKKGRNMKRDPKAMLEWLNNEVFGKRNLFAVDDLFHANFSSHNPQIGKGPEGVKAFLASLFAGFPDLEREILHVLAEGDRAVLFAHYEGTHLGPFAGVAATGRRMAIDAADILRVEDGMFIEHWDIANRVELLRILGKLEQSTA